MKSDIRPELGTEWNKVRMLEKIAMILTKIYVRMGDEEE